MWRSPANDQYADEIYLAGERVPAGLYKQIGARREVRLIHEDLLPASCDGRVACYYRLLRWDEGEHTRTRSSKGENYD
jgi:hypothetical protein